jgi:hypothetical protein
MLGSKASAPMARATTKLARQMLGAGTKNTVNVILRRRIRIKVERKNAKRSENETYHLAFLPRLVRRSLTTGTRKVAAISVSGRPFRLRTTDSRTCLYLKSRSALDRKPPIPRSMSSARKESLTTGAQVTRSGRSHTIFATAMTSSAGASIFSASKSTCSLSSVAPSLKIHYWW